MRLQLPILLLHLLSHLHGVLHLCLLHQGIHMGVLHCTADPACGEFPAAAAPEA